MDVPSLRRRLAGQGRGEIPETDGALRRGKEVAPTAAGPGKNLAGVIPQDQQRLGPRAVDSPDPGGAVERGGQQRAVGVALDAVDAALMVA